MMRKILLFIIVSIFLVLGGLTTAVMSQDVPRMTKDELKALLGSPDLVILDVRPGRDYMFSDSKIKGANRPIGDHFEIFECPEDKILVLYCASPNESFSASVAQFYKKRGFTKVHVLKGGWEEWLNAQYPTEKK